ncbi:MAG: AAA family ATPase [Nitrosarchaeum sp.]|nr:AAA family ATPase [Nitrosarchaeum sp.]
MIVTLSGKPGSGKTTVGRRLAESLGGVFFSSGDVLGRMAQEKGLVIQELDASLEKDPVLDRAFDAKQASLARSVPIAVVDGWVAYRALPESFKVFLECSLDVAARRVFEHQRPDEPVARSAEEVREALLARLYANRRRFRLVYGTDILDPGNYDLVLDTSDVSVEEICSRILARVR